MADSSQPAGPAFDDGNVPVVAVVEIAYEEGTYWRKGTKHAPSAIREMLSRLRPVSLQAGRQLRHPIGEYLVAAPYIGPYDTKVAHSDIECTIDAILESGRAPVVIGGDHSITLPVVRALARHYGAKTFSILHFDAHSDTFPGIDGYDYHHGAIFRKMVEERLVEARDIHQIGVRGLVRERAMDFARDAGINVVSVTDLRAQGGTLESLDLAIDRPHYISFDIDAVDPAFAPGTGTPVPGGFTSSEALSLLAEAAALPMLGFDLVEVAPVYDTSEITVLLAAHLLMETLIAGRFVRPPKPKKATL